MRTRHIAYVLAVLAGFPASASAQESNFLDFMRGSWSGSGTVLTKIGGSSVPIDCDFDMSGSGASVAMSGTCRSMVVVRRNITAALTASGSRYKGTYVGPSGQPSTLAGSRKGNAISLDVHWAKLTNGDRAATMRIERIGDRGLRLSTIDKDLATGRSVVTSRIDLSR